MPPHPEAGDITVDRAVPNDSGTGLKIVTCTAAPGGENETTLALTAVAGAQPVRRLTAFYPSERLVSPPRRAPKNLGVSGPASGRRR